MSERFQYRRRVEFRDTDMAGIVHFSVFFAYMEEAEHQLLRSASLGVFEEDQGHRISWPRVAAECDYHQAIRFEDELQIDVAIRQIGRTSVTYDHQFHCSGMLIATGSITTVCCRITPNQKPFPVKIPDRFVQQLSRYLQPDDHPAQS